MPEKKPRGEEQRTMLTFAQAADRLVAEEIVRSMSPEGLRKLARTDPEWTISADDYGTVAGARTLPYELLVKYMATRSKRPGRGPDRAPRVGRPKAEETTDGASDGSGSDAPAGDAD
ncbi:hypothetical protein ACFWVT_05580 [Streptomyces cyaneofuscatus]|uniref:hypothetical protein n=1 Tax=Streptomyces cyaneofuscatus TaxID=66883 RepID=UPI003646E720